MKARAALASVLVALFLCGSALGEVACPKCGTKYPDEAKFCTKDGTKLVKAKPKCLKCSKELPGSAKFCPGCGAAVKTAKAAGGSGKRLSGEKIVREAWLSVHSGGHRLPGYVHYRIVERPAEGRRITVQERVLGPNDQATLRLVEDLDGKPVSFTFKKKRATGPLVAHRSGKYAHRASCIYAKRISAEGRLKFDTLEDALAKGKLRCPTCFESGKGTDPDDRVTGTIRDGTLRLETRRCGKTSTEAKTWNDDVVFLHDIDGSPRWPTSAEGAGGTIKYPVYDATEDKFAEVTATFEGREKKEVAGEAVELGVIRIGLSTDPGLTIRAFIDEDGIPVVYCSYAPMS